MVKLAKVIENIEQIQMILKKYGIENALLFKGYLTAEKDFNLMVEFSDKEIDYYASIIKCSRELGDLLGCDVSMTAKKDMLTEAGNRNKDAANLLLNSPEEVKNKLETYFGKEWEFNEENMRDLEEEFSRDHLRGWCNIAMSSTIPKSPMPYAHYLVKEEQNWRLFHVSSIGRLGEIDINKVPNLAEALKDLPNKPPESFSYGEKEKVEEAITLYRGITPKKRENHLTSFFHPGIYSQPQNPVDPGKEAIFSQIKNWNIEDLEALVQEAQKSIEAKKGLLYTK